MYRVETLKGVYLTNDWAPVFLEDEDGHDRMMILFKGPYDNWILVDSADLNVIEEVVK